MINIYYNEVIMTELSNINKSYLYMIQNMINNKLYVGKSNNPKIRWHNHKKVALGGKEKYPEDFFAIHSAISKYGIDNFSFEIIDEFNTEQEAYDAETFVIELLESHNKNYGYNCNCGGEGGIRPNDETMAKLIAYQNRPDVKLQKSERAKAKHKKDPNYLANFNKGNQYTKGRIVSDETRNKISISGKGRIVSEDTKKKMSKAHSGENHESAKLSEVDVLYLRKEFEMIKKDKKEFMNIMGKKFGVGSKTIENVVYRISWRHI
jgi:group I intron endonuclease